MNSTELEMGRLAKRNLSFVPEKLQPVPIKDNVPLSSDGTRAGVGLPTFVHVHNVNDCLGSSWNIIFRGNCAELEFALDGAAVLSAMLDLVSSGDETVGQPGQETTALVVDPDLLVIITTREQESIFVSAKLGLVADKIGWLSSYH